MDGFSGATQVIVLGLVACVAAFDWKRFRIPNAFTIPFTIAGIAYNGYWFGMPGVFHGLTGMAVGFSLLLVPFLLGGFGGGDVKLLVSIGSWVGAGSLVEIFLVSALILGVVSAGKLLGNRVVREQAWFNLQLAVSHFMILTKFMGGEDRVEDVVCREDRGARAVPFGIVMVGGIVTLLAYRACTNFGPW